MADEELIAKDLPEYIATLKEIDEQVSEISQRVGGLIAKIDDEDISTAKGISFLEVKTQLLLSYLINIVYYMLLKSDGEKIEGDSAIDRLVEIRTVLEKLRPIDQKMKYQIDKLIKMITTGMTAGDSDPLRFKPNPENMAAKLGEADEDESDESADETHIPSKSGVYVPPKVTAVPYDDGRSSKKDKKTENAKKRALGSSIIQELRDEYSETPMEIREEVINDWRSSKKQEDEAHQQNYEEDNFLRLPTKKQKKGNPRASSTLDELTSFTSLSVLSGDQTEEGGDSSYRRSSGKKKKPKWKRKSSAKKRRIRH
ncbi:neuroguidin-like [Actinia tenebrosa]|uniref:Neuroguidin-like n=1 Tax=Actinia tenebrosa TaxID=6105 RepID=A0A6P8I5G4_ACTTE|nr:neuroguidin-like [Actinia tenebrosa]